ncbi:MAG: hypothetical protein HYV06_07755 [Deltaproteobacteria bacterium]|nr:hypothetical protein [Deltaproteobacteria bacterium]
MRIRRGDIVRLLVASALIACLAACGNGGGPNATGGGGGIVGTGKRVVASGEVNGLGSVIVNGIEFTRSGDPAVSTAPILLAFDNFSTASEDVLRSGMVVAVSGSYDTASGRGSYTRIVYSPDLRGPLDNGSVDDVAGTFTLLGRTVQAGAATIFDGIADLNELAGRQNQNLELEVSGYLDARDRIQASRVALKSAGFINGPIQLKGAITLLGDGSFSIGGVNVTTSNATFVDMSSAELALPGLVVEVRGILAGSVVGNARIERKSSTSGVSAGETMRIKGVAAGALSGNSFVMAGPDGALTVTTSAAAFLRGGNPADAAIVAAGARLEVEGTVLADGTLAARKVTAETQRRVRLEGDLTSVNLTAGTLTLNGVAVKAGAGTAFRDNRKTPQQVTNLTLAGLSPGDHLQVIGFADVNGQVVAGEVQRFDARQVAILQGRVTAVDLAAARLTILGVTVTPALGVELVKGGASYGDLASFAAQVATGSTVIKAKGTSTGSVFSASSLEIEQ